MFVVPIRVIYAAYGVFGFTVGTPYWNYINVYGRCFDCNDFLMKETDRPFAHIELQGASREDADAFAASLTPFDLRTLDMIKAGCCPPRLTAHLLETEG